ncbi:unnamed protein product, partial [Durusdinium trenchii]
MRHIPLNFTAILRRHGLSVEQIRQEGRYTRKSQQTVLDSPSSSKSKEDFHVAMQLAAETGDLEHIAELVDEMADKGIQPKEDTYSLIFKVCQHSLDSKTKTFAERYFLAMISIGIEPQESTLSLMDKV